MKINCGKFPLRKYVADSSILMGNAAMLMCKKLLFGEGCQDPKSSVFYQSLNADYGGKKFLLNEGNHSVIIKQT